MIDWLEFTELVKTAHIAQGDESLEDNQRQHAGTFAALGMAILTLKHELAGLNHAANKSVLVSPTGERIVKGE